MFNPNSIFNIKLHKGVLNIRIVQAPARQALIGEPNNNNYTLFVPVETAKEPQQVKNLIEKTVLRIKEMENTPAQTCGIQ